MSITFVNTVGVGFAYAAQGSGNPSNSLLTPSAAAIGKLLSGIIGIDDITLPSTDSLVLSTGQTGIGGVAAGSAVSMAMARYLFSGAPPATVDLSTTPTSGYRNLSSVIILGGVDLVNPIRDFNVNQGTGATVTFPNTGSVQAGDFVFRSCRIDKEDFDLSYSAVPDTQIWQEVDAIGIFKTCGYEGYKVMGSNTTPGTAVLTASRSNINWTTMTVVYAAAAVDANNPEPWQQHGGMGVRLAI